MGEKQNEPNSTKDELKTSFLSDPSVEFNTQHGIGEATLEEVIDSDKAQQPLKTPSVQIQLSSSSLGQPSFLGGVAKRFFPTGFADSFASLFSIAWPIMLSQLNILLFCQVSTPFIGRLGTTAQLSAVGLGASVANVAGMSFMWGLSTGAETLGSQAWGAGNKRRLVLICQRCLLIGLMAVLPCWCIYLSVGPILRLMHQDPEVIYHVNLYIYGYLPALPLTALFISLMKFLQSQQIVIPVVFAGLAANAMNVLFHYLFVQMAGLGLLGAALSTDLTVLIFAILLILYIRFKRLYVGCWQGWSRECLFDWGEYLKLAVPGMFMICLEWWAFEIGMITTGLLGKDYLATNTLCLTFGAYAYLLLSGVQIGSIILVGNYLGEGKSDHAMTVARVALVFGILFFGTVFFLVFFLLHNQLPFIFTSKEKVVELTSEALKVVAFMQVADTVVNVASGVLKGAGKQFFGAVTNFIGYYFIGLPLGIVLMMPFGADMKVPGYWWGQVAGLTFSASAYMIYLTFKIDWNKTAAEASRRAAKHAETMDATQNRWEVKNEDIEKKDGDEVEFKEINGKANVEAAKGPVPWSLAKHWFQLVWLLFFSFALIACFSYSVQNTNFDLSFSDFNLTSETSRNETSPISFPNSTDSTQITTIT